ncbi:MAG: DUF3168 domain-containing protein [Planctomycetes bacterium]|nr:DUF3168 domain-containing protein [Planctomycetota bacterium]
MAMIQGVHDHVSQESPFPYVTIGDEIARDWSAAGVEGVEAMLVLHVWSRARGRKEVKQILADTTGDGALPSTIVTDDDGNVLLSVSGIPTVSQLRKLLATPPASQPSQSKDEKN